MTPELAPEILLSAYGQGIFPMADGEGGEIQWFSPDPRAILEIEGFHTSKSLRQTVRQGKFDLRINADFPAVIRACGDDREGTWISEELREAYVLLHRLGFAHSVEAYREGELAGGLYGVAIGGAFFGESMFHRATDASKVALVHLVEHLQGRGFVLLDVQFITPHLARFGAKEIPREDYLARLEKAILLRCSFVEPGATE